MFILLFQCHVLLLKGVHTNGNVETTIDTNGLAWPTLQGDFSIGTVGPQLVLCLHGSSLVIVDKTNTDCFNTGIT